MAGQGVRSAIGRGLLGTALLAGSWVALRSAGVQRADVRAGDAVRRAGGPLADRAVTATTDLGSLYAVAAIAGTLAASGRRRAAADVLGIGGLAWGVAQSSKRRVRRDRPYETATGVRRLVRPPAGSSFPSGHAAVGAAVMSLMAERSRGAAGRALLRTFAGYVALSRVYVGVHYPTDVIGGAGLGLVLSAAWRGPVAALGRATVAAVTRGAAAGGRVGAGAGRALAAAAPWPGRLSRRPRRSGGAAGPGGAVPSAPSRPSAAPPRRRSGG